MADRGVLIRGFFMLGFPTETLEEIEATIDYAVNSNLTQAYFFNVVPQPGTPLYDLAMHENAAALQSQTLQEYNANTTWYAAAYGVDMRKVIKHAYFRFFVLSPRRWPRLVRMMPWRSFVTELRAAITLFTVAKAHREPGAARSAHAAHRSLHAGRELRDQRGNAQAAARHPVDALRRCLSSRPGGPKPGPRPIPWRDESPANHVILPPSF